MNVTNSIYWFRQDLRLTDNPALFEISKLGSVLPIYILDNKNADDCFLGEASRVWLHHSLHSLNNSLQGNLSVYCGDPISILNELIQKYHITTVYWNRCYEPWRIKRDQKIKTNLKHQNITVHSFNSALLWEPWEIKKSDGTPYRVFSHFYYKGCLHSKAPREPIQKPTHLKYIQDTENLQTIESLNLLPEKKWHLSLISKWEIGEEGAQKTLNRFLKNGIHQYKNGRNFPSKPYTSKLAPYLHFGQISPHQIWYSKELAIENNREVKNKNIDHFFSELGWREFSYHLLYHHPNLHNENLQNKFNHFPWNDDTYLLSQWQQGKTGIPIVDAGMRELWQTGYMHNRVRMIVGSFLVKNLLLHWKQGERWFWDCLFDADLANNSASWQWVAGCGADAAPYFRIFNPVLQGEKFDPQGEYTYHFVPELKSMPIKYLFKPWEAPKEVLQQANIELGTTYPKPIVDLKISRNKALEAFKTLKSN